MAFLKIEWKISTFRQTSALFQLITFNAPLVKLDFSSVPMLKKIKIGDLSRSCISLILQSTRRLSYIAEFVITFMNFEIHRDQFVISPWLLSSYRKSWHISFLKNGLLAYIIRILAYFNLCTLRMIHLCSKYHMPG